MTDPTDLLAQTTHEFLDALASRQPTPGGGCAAALAGALAVALARMVTAYARGRDGEVDAVKQVAEPLARADAMLRRLVNEDAAAYQAYAEARRSADPSEAARAAGVAVAVPLEIAAVAGAVLADMNRVKEQLNRNLISDLGVVAVLADACVRAAAYSVRINLRDAAATDPQGKVREELEHLLRHADEARAALEGFVDAQL
ncbi:MAG: hypothetical protein GY842_15805 [bacterium]|nr:hypothetical protein [bacterium]